MKIKNACFALLAGLGLSLLAGSVPVAGQDLFNESSSE